MVAGGWRPSLLEEDSDGDVGVVRSFGPGGLRDMAPKRLAQRGRRGGRGGRSQSSANHRWPNKRVRHTASAPSHKWNLDLDMDLLESELCRARASGSRASVGRHAGHRPVVDPPIENSRPCAPSARLRCAACRRPLFRGAGQSGSGDEGASSRPLNLDLEMP